MLKNLLILFTLSLFSWSLMGQCPTGSVFLQSQADVDQFLIDYPSCTEIAGFTFRIGVTSGTSDITDISGLSNLTVITSD